MQSAFSSQLLVWYAQNARQLPWRDHPDPYAVWISEIMLQQTRVETVKPYFERWMRRFPTVQALAEASQQEVLAAWEGLGYYTRARNLHRAAQQVMAKFNGQIPRDPQDLQRLPGIGRYTAGAIASMAFGVDAAALDGNIRRVLARVFDVAEPAQSQSGLQRLWKLAGEHLPAGHAGEYNQALMDLGTAICTPRHPDCSSCPLKLDCRAYALGIQEQRPVSKPRPVAPHYTVTAAVIRRDGQVLIAQRPAQGLLGGLWEFPGGKLQEGEDLGDCLRREIYEELGVDVAVGAQVGIYRHAYTHFRVTLHAFYCQLEQGEPQALEATALRWVPPEALAEYPMGKIDRQIAAQIINRGGIVNEDR
jgi:A/G-specific adenine glycosylase